VIAPLVSRHIDFLEALAESQSLGVEADILKRHLSQTVLLLGSAPVGPKTCERLLKYAGRLPTVRFGSTETTLQVFTIQISLDYAHVFTSNYSHANIVLSLLLNIS